MIKSRRDIKKIATAYLVFYLTFLGFAAFHTHKVDIQSNNTVLSGQKNSSPKSIDPFLDEDSKCRLYNFTSDKFILTPTIYSSVEIPEEFFYQQRNYANLSLTKYFYNIDLRAPPLSA